MADVLFLSEAVLKQQSILQDNVDMKVVTPIIREVQYYYVLPILGTALYEDLVAKVAAGTLSNTEKDLLDDYIIPCMVQYCKYELPMAMNYKYFNKSVGVQNADNMNPASLDEIRAIEDRAKNKAEWYAERLTKYLLANPTLFPLYLSQPNANIDTIYAKRTNYTSGMYLGDNGCCMGDDNFKGIRIQPSEYRKCSYC